MYKPYCDQRQSQDPSYCPNNGLPHWCSGKESACQCRGWGLEPWVGKIPWRRRRQPAPVFLPGESHGQRSLAGSPWSRKRVRHNWVTERMRVHTHTHTHTHTNNNRVFSLGSAQGLQGKVWHWCWIIPGLNPGHHSSLCQIWRIILKIE